MPESLTVNEWIEAIDRHYLAEYLPQGGSSVKFAVCYPGTDHRQVATGLRSRAEHRNFLVADIDASLTKVHLIEQVFGRIADQIPWHIVIDRVLARFATDNQWRIPTSFSNDGIVHQLDQLNQLSTQQISLDLQRQINQQILINREFAKDFRVAMYWLARTRLDAPLQGSPTLGQITDWLGGRIRLISELKQYQIFSKITRVNARHLLGSLLVLIRKAGFSGLVVTMDGFRLLDPTKPSDESVRYTKAALFDAYEVFREFVDNTDALDGLLLSILVPQNFLVDSDPRGLRSYLALHERVQDELRSHKYANPLTAMTRINDATGAVA